MIRLAAAALAVVLGGGEDLSRQGTLIGADAPTHGVRSASAGVLVHQQIMIRVYRSAPGAPANVAPDRMREVGRPRCIPARAITAAVPGQTQVDLLLSGNRLVRAELGQRCAALNYYRGLYLDERPDGQICAGRDAVRSRMGGQCEITRFRLFEAISR